MGLHDVTVDVPWIRIPCIVQRPQETRRGTWGWLADWLETVRGDGVAALANVERSCPGLIPQHLRPGLRPLLTYEPRWAILAVMRAPGATVDSVLLAGMRVATEQWADWHWEAGVEDDGKSMLFPLLCCYRLCIAGAIDRNVRHNRDQDGLMRIVSVHCVL